MTNVFKLIKLSWVVKSDIARCLAFKEGTDEYRLAKHYEEMLNSLGDRQNNDSEIKKLLLEIRSYESKYAGRKELEALLGSASEFLMNIN